MCAAVGPSPDMPQPPLRASTCPCACAWTNGGLRDDPRHGGTGGGRHTHIPRGVSESLCRRAECGPRHSGRILLRRKTRSLPRQRRTAAAAAATAPNSTARAGTSLVRHKNARQAVLVDDATAQVPCPPADTPVMLMTVGGAAARNGTPSCSTATCVPGAVRSTSVREMNVVISFMLHTHTRTCLSHANANAAHPTHTCAPHTHSCINCTCVHVHRPPPPPQRSRSARSWAAVISQAASPPA